MFLVVAFRCHDRCLPETGQGGRVSPPTCHARWRMVMRNYQRVCSYHKPPILFCHTIKQNTFTRKDGCALHTAANSDTAARRLADFLHLLPSTYNKHKGTIQCRIVYTTGHFRYKRGGWRGDSSGIDGALGPVLLSGVGWCSGARCG